MLIALGGGFLWPMFMTKALQNELAGRVAPIIYMAVINSLLIGFVWCDESIPVPSLLGIALIASSILLNLRVNHLPEKE